MTQTPRCERFVSCALRSRGLQDNHILLARLISDRDPSARLLVLDRLHQSPDLEPGVWLQRLSSDPAGSPCRRHSSGRDPETGRSSRPSP